MAQDRLELSASHQPTAALPFFSEGESQRLEAAVCDDFVPRVFPLWTHEREKSFEVTTSKQFFAASKSRLRLVGSPTLCDCEIWQGQQMWFKDAKSEVFGFLLNVLKFNNKCWN
jgi:hypothetical protein